MNKLIGFEDEYTNLLEKLNEKTLSNSLLISGSKGIGKFLFIYSVIKEFIRTRVGEEKLTHHYSLLENNSHPNISIIKKEFDEKIVINFATTILHELLSVKL